MKNHFLCLENIMTPNQVQFALQACVFKRNFEESFLTGNSAFLENKAIRKIACNAQWARLMAELLEVNYLRLAFTQSMAQQTCCNPQGALKELLQTPTSLQQLSCLQGIEGGLVLCLSSAKGELPPPFSVQAGSGVYIRGDFPVCFQKITEQGDGKWLLIAYGKKNALYTLHEPDPHTHALKRQGYVFGDRLKDYSHPPLFRA